MKCSDNVAVDTLTGLGAAREVIPADTFLEHQHKPSVKLQAEPEEALASTTLEATEDDHQAGPGATANAALVVILAWTQPLLAYLINKELPADKNEARRKVCRSKAYTVIQGELYKCNITGMFKWGLLLEEGRQLLQDIHAGAYGHHAAPRTLMGNAFCHCFYWPHASGDAEDIMRRCAGCQRFTQKSHMPATTLKNDPSHLAFCRMGA